MASRSGERYARRSRVHIPSTSGRRPAASSTCKTVDRVPAIEGWEVSNMTSGTLAGEGRSRRYHVKPSPCDRWERCGRGPTRRATATIASVSKDP
eukprot:scaffold18684_cov121-Isochrysis_galbana.AAC.1